MIFTFFCSSCSGNLLDMRICTYMQLTMAPNISATVFFHYIYNFTYFVRSACLHLTDTVAQLKSVSFHISILLIFHAKNYNKILALDYNFNGIIRTYRIVVYFFSSHFSVSFSFLFICVLIRLNFVMRLACKLECFVVRFSLFIVYQRMRRMLVQITQRIHTVAEKLKVSMSQDEDVVDDYDYEE